MIKQLEGINNKINELAVKRKHVISQICINECKLKVGDTITIDRIRSGDGLVDRIISNIKPYELKPYYILYCIDGSGSGENIVNDWNRICAVNGKTTS